MVRNHALKDCPKISTPNSKNHNELGYILNLACLKATGCYLPASFHTQDWFYKIDEKGIRRAKYKPESIPALLNNPYSICSPDGIEHRIKRLLICDELKVKFSPDQPPNKDCVIYILIPFARAYIDTLPTDWSGDPDIPFSIRSLRHIPKQEVIMSGFNGLIDPKIPKEIYQAAQDLYKQSNGLFNYKNAVGHRYEYGEDIDKLLKQSNFEGNKYYTNKNTITRYDREKNPAYSILNDINTYSTFNTLFNAVKDDSVKKYLFSWMNRVYENGIDITELENSVKKVLSFKHKLNSCPSNADSNNYCDTRGCKLGRNIKISGSRNLSNPPASSHYRMGEVYMDDQYNKVLWFDKIKGLNTTLHGGHQQSHILTNAGCVPVRQACWSPAFWMAVKIFRDNVGRHLHLAYDQTTLGGLASYQASRRDRRKVWNKIRLESHPLTQLPKRAGFETRFLESIMTLVS